MIDTTPQGVVLRVRVMPRAGRSGIAGTRDGALLVRLAAAPVDGAANAELIDILSDALDVARRSLTIISGERGRAKRVLVKGAAASEIAARLPKAG